MMVLIVIFFCQLPLAAPVAYETGSFSRFLIAGVKSFVGITLPLLIFLFSGLLPLESKQDCPHGWLDCFINGKEVLAPFAVWATAALYAVDVLKVQNRCQTWIVLGILSGAILSDVCLAYVVMVGGRLNDLPIPLLALPVGMAIWYTVRACQLIHAARLSPWTYIVSQLISAPFWFASYVWSKNIYAALPDKVNGCFIVTAASHGHASFTGPHTEIIRHGRRLRANQQLLTFWELESHWQKHAPRSHANFRQIYNRLGPIIAARIKSPWLADAVYLGLKPLEIVARWINGKD